MSIGRLGKLMIRGAKALNTPSGQATIRNLGLGANIGIRHFNNNQQRKKTTDPQIAQPKRTPSNRPNARNRGGY